MRQLSNIKLLPILMVLTIIGITGFQLYWLEKAYDREKKNIEQRTNLLFRETVRTVQGSKLNLERLLGDSAKNSKSEHDPLTEQYIRKGHADQKMAALLDILMQKIKDSARKAVVIKHIGNRDTAMLINKGFRGRRNRLLQFLVDVDSLQDSVKVSELQVAFAHRLKEQAIPIPFSVSRVPTKDTAQPVYNQVTLGFTNPITYRLDLGNMFPFIIKRISVPILFSLFLIAFTILSFLVLYRNVLRQNRLANIKNDFISNITHELKTPIATVSVAIEALRNFSSSIDPARTKEYLDISANELQRLSLLVDKVLKLSMFEKREIELKYELLNMKDLVDEVTSSMRLQFEKHHAVVNIHSEGDTTLEGDRLHLLSVIFNLFDNALKYSSQNPEIDINVYGDDNKVCLTISDSGIGIPSEYQNRIFEKFFRVPTGNLHNAKGYGLGLSYVAHVVNRHTGVIKVESAVGDGSRFIIDLPKHRA